MAWTDKRLQERFDGIDRRFDEVDRRFNEVDRRFGEVDRRFDRVDGEVLELRREMRSEIGDLRMAVNRVGGGIVVGLIGVIAAIVSKGV